MAGKRIDRNSSDLAAVAYFKGMFTAWKDHELTATRFKSGWEIWFGTVQIGWVGYSGSAGLVSQQKK